MLIFLLMVVGFALWVMTPAQRARLVRAVLAAIRHVKGAPTQGRPQPSFDAFRARTPWALVTLALVALNAAIFVLMIFGATALSDPATLVDWGGNFGPRTTNGEWWRLVTTMFIHAGTPHLVANVVGLIQLGLILERLAGHLAFAAVYVVAGVFASLVSLSAYPVAVSVGASGAIFGIYGLLLASLIWGVLQRSTVTIPLIALKRLGPAAAVFVLYNVTTDGLGGAAEVAGLVAGFVCGLILRGLGDRKPSARQVAAVMTAAFVIVVASAVRLRGIADVRPEIKRIIAVEDRTVRAYRDAADRFKKGGMAAEALVQLIDRTIVPELQAADARLKALDRVPHEYQPLVAGAEEYLRLREESWRLRAEGLRKNDMLTLREAERTESASDESRRRRAEALHRANLFVLGKAETTERASLQALERIKPADHK